MKQRIFSFVSILTFALALATFASAQLRLPRPSPKASVMQTVGITDITITYSRPPVKGRPIFRDPPESMAARAKGEATLDDQNKRLKDEPIVPFGHVWRTGANDATQFVVTDDVTINGQKLAAGSYSLHTIPGKKEWTIVFNGTANQWGSFNYDPAKDSLRVKTTPQKAKKLQEWMMFSIDPLTDSTATVNITWEKVTVPFTVSVDVVATTLAKARLTVAAAPADNWQILYNAGTYAVQSKATDEGMKWFEQALKTVDASIKAKEAYGNLAGRANILLSLGRNADGFAAADKAIERGKADKANTAGLEKRVADIKAGKQ